MPIIAGIDEAGYGPTFGPLVVTSTVFSVPESSKRDLWELLEDVVSREICRSDEKIVITDSKKVYSRSKGLHRLEDSVLSFMYCLKSSLNSFKDVLQSFSYVNNDNLNIYPWYSNKDLTLPIASKWDSISMYSNKLTNLLKKFDVGFLGIKSLPIPVYDFNKEINKIGNKANLLFNKCGALLIDIWNRFGELSPKVYIDKLGGRNHYLPLLYTMFDNCFIRIDKESASKSVYEVIGDKKRMFISFIQGSETKHFPIALASMCSKYIREIYITMFNLFWQEIIPNIKPTAGYYQDAKRFLEQIADAKVKLGIKDELMIRVK